MHTQILKWGLGISMVIVENTCKCIHGKKVDFSDNYELQYNLIIKKNLPQVLETGSKNLQAFCMKSF